MRSIAIICFFAFCTVYSRPGPVLIMFGTRPETIKLAPVYNALKSEGIETLLCNTGQHRDSVYPILQLFGAKPDFDFEVMKHNQDLFHITQTILDKAKALYQEVKPSLVIIQGDTTTGMAAALAAFYMKIPVGHVEAGLRSGNLLSPYPEEVNRRFISLVSRYHFAPTMVSYQNLAYEKMDPKAIFCTGNTVVDALYTIRNLIEKGEVAPSKMIRDVVAKCDGKEIVLMTTHRRESFDGGLVNIFTAMKEALQADPKLSIIYPIHPNPIIRKTFDEVGLDQLPNLHLVAPLPYEDLVYVLSRADCVATDSGGIQEEAMSLDKRLLVLRNETDRPEGLYGEHAKLVGTDKTQILYSLGSMIGRIRSDGGSGLSMHMSPYGEGHASKRIAYLVKQIIYNLPPSLEDCPLQLPRYMTEQQADEERPYFEGYELESQKLKTISNSPEENPYFPSNRSLFNPSN